MQKIPLFGSLNHQIVIIENNNFDELGLERWEEKYITFAEINPLYDSKVGSVENFSFGHVVTEGYFLFKIRALLGVTIKMRVKYSDRLFEIKRIIDVDEKGRVLKIIALEI